MGHTILAWITQAWAPSLGYILYVYIIIVLKTTLWSRSYDPILQKNELSLRENKLLSKVTQFKNDQIVTEHTRVCHFDSLLNCTKLFHIVSESPAPGAMAPHSSPLAWKIPWTEEPGRLQSMGSLRVGHGWATSLSLFTFMHWRRKWQPTPVFLPGESQGRGSLVDCRLWGRTELDMTEAT